MGTHGPSSGGGGGQGFGHWLITADYPGSWLFQTADGDRALAMAQTVAVYAAAGAAIAATAGSASAVFIEGAALKAAGGAASGARSAALQGKGGGAIVQQALINAVVSAVNPAGGITAHGITSGAINSGISNAANQYFTSGSVNPMSVAG